MVIRLGDPFTGAFMVSTDSYLYLSRHHVYYFRAIVPDGIKPELHKREYRRSMQTRSIHLARKIARALRVCFEGHLEGLRASMVSWEELRKILGEKLQQQLALEREKLSSIGPYPAIADDIWKDNVIPNYTQAVKDISFFGAGQPDGYIPDFARRLAQEILDEKKLDLAPTSEQFTRFCEATVRMHLEFTKRRMILNDEARTLLPVEQLSPPAPTVVTNQPSALISQVIEDYCHEMVSDKRWTKKSELAFRGSFSILLRIVNDRPISAFNRNVARSYKEALQKLPSNMTKKPQYRDLSIGELLATNIPHGDRLSASKVNLDLGRVSALFNWAVLNELTDKNPFSGMKIKDSTNPQEKRLPFETEDLLLLFGAKQYKKMKFLHPHYYWLPLLGLYTGARIDELCQLYLDDFCQLGDIWTININTIDDKKTKNITSCRKVPIHSRLIDLGLLDYISSLKKKKEARLFPELKLGRDGYSHEPSKWFGRFSDTCGVTDSKKTFHSFRHTLIEALKLQSIVTEEKMDKVSAIVGHKIENMTKGYYGKPYQPDILSPLIETLNFPIDVPKWKG